MRRAQLKRCRLTSWSRSRSPCALPAVAVAGAKDTDALVAVAESLNDFVERKNRHALKKLEDALKACAGSACEPTRARSSTWRWGSSTAPGWKGFNKASPPSRAPLREDPKVAPDRQFMTQGAQQALRRGEGQREEVGRGPARPRPAQQGAARLGRGRAGPARSRRTGATAWARSSRHGRERVRRRQAGARAVRGPGGLILEASGDAKRAQKFAEEESNTDVKKKADELLARLANDTPTIVVVVPKTIDDVEIRIDGVVVPKDKADKPIPHNPGKATIEVGARRALPLHLQDRPRSFDRGERITVNATDDKSNNSAVPSASASAHALRREHVHRDGRQGPRPHLPRRPRDRDRTTTTARSTSFADAVLLGREPHGGLARRRQLHGRRGVQRLARHRRQATRRFDEVRHAGSLAGRDQDRARARGLDGGVSIEPDYVGRNGGRVVQRRSRQQEVTPTLGLSRRLRHARARAHARSTSLLAQHPRRTRSTRRSRSVASPTTIVVVASDGGARPERRHVEALPAHPDVRRAPGAVSDPARRGTPSLVDQHAPRARTARAGPR